MGYPSAPGAAAGCYRTAPHLASAPQRAKPSCSAPLAQRACCGGSCRPPYLLPAPRAGIMLARAMPTSPADAPEVLEPVSQVFAGTLTFTGAATALSPAE